MCEKFKCVVIYQTRRVSFKDTHREKAPSNKTLTLQKVWIWTFGWLGHQINSLYEILKLKQNVRKNKVVTGETSFFVIGLFCTSHSIYLKHCLLTEQFCLEMMRFQSSYFQLKNGCTIFFETGLNFSGKLFQN